MALVVLQPASGRRITGDSVITTATIAEFAPDPGDAAFVRDELAQAGFSVGPVAGISMSVSAPRERFERYFGTKVRPAADGGWQWAAGDTRELPSDRVPDAVAPRVHAVTFEEPAELMGTDP